MAKDWPCLKTAAVKPVYNGHPWDSKKWPLFKSGRYSEIDP